MKHHEEGGREELGEEKKERRKRMRLVVLEWGGEWGEGEGWLKRKE